MRPSTPARPSLQERLTFPPRIEVGVPCLRLRKHEFGVWISPGDIRRWTRFLRQRPRALVRIKSLHQDSNHQAGETNVYTSGQPIERGNANSAAADSDECERKPVEGD